MARSTQTPEELTWDLTSIFNSDKDWAIAYRHLSNELSSMNAYKGRLSESGQTLWAALQLQDSLFQRLDRLDHYADLRYHRNTTNSNYTGMVSQVQALRVKLDSTCAFVKPELLGIPSRSLQGMRARTPQLHQHDSLFASLEYTRTAVYSAKIERIIAQFNPDSASYVYGTLTSGELIVEPWNAYASSQSVRRRSFKKFYGTYSKFRNTIAALYAVIIEAQVAQTRIRGFDSTLSRALADSDIPEAVYKKFVTSVHKGLPLLHRYFKLRQQVLKCRKLHLYDLDIALVAGVDYAVTPQQAMQICRKALAPLGNNYVNQLTNNLQERLIDWLPAVGKHEGAQCFSAYGAKAYVMLNWQGDLDSLFNLVHELGHAQHYQEINRHQPYSNSHLGYLVAEVAALVNELLLADYLLKGAKNQAQKAYFLTWYLGRHVGYLFQQTMLAEFEQRTYLAAERGTAITADYLCQSLSKLYQKYYAPALEVGPDIAVEWASIPHLFELPFYLYQYGFAMSAATVIANKILSHQQSAVSAYIRFLRSGSSSSSLELLQLAGADWTNDNPVQETLHSFAKALHQLEDLLLP